MIVALRTYVRKMRAMMNEQQVEQINQRVLTTIRSIRERHGACTARAVANELRMSPDAIRYRCQALRDAGRVNWTDMPGSLHVVEPIEDQLAELAGNRCECGWPTEKALEMHRRKAH